MSLKQTAGHSHTPDSPAVRLEGLTKTFAGGVAAVRALSLSIERGYVFGLLGPNGSGKTTTMRMMLGLVRPTAGRAYIFGQQVSPGHQVLRRVGVLVERPGFVPYFSGRRNLETFWRAGGQSLDEADIEGALRVAGLGDAIDRRAGDYSKGMQQRLGLAQALLNRPDLLVLDEPTVGLDPQEVREVRTLIRDIAERGSTVILSSHVLAEVEQLCSHVAVLDHGRLAASGALSDLTQAGSSVYIEVDDIEQAAAVLGRLPGVAAVSREAPGLSITLDGLERAAVVSALTQHGVGVRTITARQRLEDAFVQALSDEPQ